MAREEELAHGVREPRERERLGDRLQPSGHRLLRPGVARQDEGRHRVHDDGPHELHLAREDGRGKDGEAHRRDDKGSGQTEQCAKRRLQRYREDVLHEHGDEQVREHGEHEVEHELGDEQQPRRPLPVALARAQLLVLAADRRADGEEDALLERDHREAEQEEEHVALRRVVEHAQMGVDRRDHVLQELLIATRAQGRALCGEAVREVGENVLHGRARDVRQDDVRAVGHVEHLGALPRLDLAREVRRNLDGRIRLLLAQRLAHVLLAVDEEDGAHAVAALDVADELAREVRVLRIVDDARHVLDDVRHVEQAEDDEVGHGRAEQEDEAARVVQGREEFTPDGQEQFLHADSSSPVQK